MTIGKLSLPAIGISAVVNIVLATLWYRPFLFGKIWQGYTGNAIIGPPDPAKLVTGIICSIVLVLALAVLFKLTGIQGLKNGLLLGLLAGFGLIAAAALPIHLYNGYKIGLFFVDSGLTITQVLIASAVLSLFSK